MSGPSTPTPPPPPNRAQRPSQAALRLSHYPERNTTITTYLNLTAPTGGAGVTTLAILTAYKAAADGLPVALVSKDTEGYDDILATIGAPIRDRFPYDATQLLTIYDGSMGIPDMGHDLVICDGFTPPVNGNVVNLTVVRGPSYNGLRKAMNSNADGFIIVTEPGRVLTAEDASGCLGREKAIITFPIDPAVARAGDAGIVPPKVYNLPTIQAILTALNLTTVC